jgi:hypothetical protein
MLEKIESDSEEQEKALKALINSNFSASEVNVEEIVGLLVEKFDFSKEDAMAYINEKSQELGLPASLTAEKWENPYDELFNLDKQLSATIRERERAERAYERALKDTSVTAKELAEITEKQLLDLQKEADIQKDRSQQALGKIEVLMNENQQYSDLYSFDPNTGLINVDWAKAKERFKSPEDGEEFQ